MVVWYAGVITLVCVIVIITIMVWVIWRCSPKKPKEGVISKIYKIRFRYFLILTTVAIILVVITLSFLPYYQTQKKIPNFTVSVVGKMWSWEINPVDNPHNMIKKDAQGQLTFPVNEPIEFMVTSKDVNHGFGIYNAKGQLLTQTQAMPGYVNRLIYTFHKAGKYSVLCMEYCGLAHHVMMSHFTVK